MVSNISKLKEIAIAYKGCKKQFFNRQSELIEQFGLSADHDRKIAFGIVETENPELIEIVDCGLHELDEMCT